MNKLSIILAQADSNPEIIGYLFVSALVLLFVFTIFRSVALWYWRVKEIVDNQEKTNRLLERILNRLDDKSRDQPENI